MPRDATKKPNSGQRRPGSDRGRTRRRASTRWSHRGFARGSSGRGELERAEDLARKALDDAARGDDYELHAAALLDLSEILLLAGRLEQAVPALEGAIRIYEQKEDVQSARQARALLDRARTSSLLLLGR